MPDCFRVSPPPTTIRLASMGTSFAHTAFTPWRATHGCDSIVPALFARAHVAGVSDLVTRLAVQTAAVRPDDPDGWVNEISGTAILEISGADVACAGVKDISTLLDGKMFARFGAGVKTTSTGAPASADIGLLVAPSGCGGIVASWSGLVIAASQTAVVTPVSGFLLAAGAGAVKGSILLTGVGQDVQAQLVWRAAEMLPSEPASSWTTPSQSVANAANPARVTTFTPSVGSNLLIQFGIATSLAQGSTPAGAQAVVMIGMKHA